MADAGELKVGISEYFTNFYHVYSLLSCGFHLFTIWNSLSPGQLHYEMDVYQGFAQNRIFIQMCSNSFSPIHFFSKFPVFSRGENFFSLMTYKPV